MLNGEVAHLAVGSLTEEVEAIKLQFLFQEELKNSFIFHTILQGDFYFIFFVYGFCCANCISYWLRLTVTVPLKL